MTLRRDDRGAGDELLSQVSLAARTAFAMRSLAHSRRYPVRPRVRLLVQAGAVRQTRRQPAGSSESSLKMLTLPTCPVSLTVSQVRASDLNITKDLSASASAQSDQASDLSRTINASSVAIAISEASATVDVQLTLAASSTACLIQARPWSPVTTFRLL